MAKKIVEGGADKREALLKLLRAKAPAIFEREAAPAFAEGNLQALADAILAL